MSLKLVYFLIPLNIFCSYSSVLQFGSTIKLFSTTILILFSLFILINLEKQLKKSTLLFLSIYAVYPIILSLISSQSLFNISFLAYSNLVFLFFIYLTFNENLLKPFLISISISLFFLLPLAYFLKENNIYGDPAGNTNSLSQLVSVGIISTLYLIFKRELPKNFVVISWLLIFISIYFLLELKSRGSFLVLLVAFMTMTFLHYFKLYKSKITRQHYVVGGISLCLVLIVSIFFLNQMDVSNFQNLAYRKNLWHAGFKILNDHGVIGIGNGNLSYVLPHYWDINTNLLSGAGETEYHLHNEFLNKAVEEGFLSLLLFLALVAYSLYSGISYYLNPNNKNSHFVLPLVGIFTGICMQIFFDRILQFPTTGLFFALLCGILITVNESNGQKPFKISRFLIAFIAIIHAIFAWPFLYQQLLYVSSNNISELSINKIEQIKEDLSKSKNIVEFKNNVMNRLQYFPQSSLKISATKLLNENQEFNKSSVNSFAAILIDLELNWSKNFEYIIHSADFKDLKAMAYQKYIRLLEFQNRKEEMLTFLLKMNSEFPLMLDTTFQKYDYYVGKHEFKKALNCLQESAKLTNNPKLKKIIILHKLKVEKHINIKELEDCIILRRKIEFDNKFVKKNLVGRFDTFESYFIEFIGELFLLGEYDKGNKLLLDYIKEDSLRKKPNFIKFINYIQTSYPEIYNKLPMDLISK